MSKELIDKILAMTDEELCIEFTKIVKSSLIEQFNITNEIVSKFIQDSPFTVLMEEDFKFVLHYGVQYWVEKIAEENGLLA